VASRRRRADLALSLFPFLSVLACVIGTLTLLLAALAIGSMGGQSLEQVRLAERFQLLQAWLTGGRAELELLEAQVHRLESEADAGAELGRRLSGQGLSLEISLDDLEAIAELRKRMPTLDERKRLLERETERLEVRLSEQQETIESREEIQRDVPIIVDPSGIGPDRRPYLVECRAEFLQIHSTRGDWSYPIPKREILNSEQFKKFLRRVKAIHNGIVIFLIRPDGVWSYNEAEVVATGLRVRHAKLPLPGQGRLDFSRLRDS
jgi:hypothetical protein